MLARLHFQQKVQMQPPQEKMNNIKRKKKCENEVYELQSSEIDPFKSAVDDPSFCLNHCCCRLIDTFQRSRPKVHSVMRKFNPGPGKVVQSSVNR